LSDLVIRKVNQQRSARHTLQPGRLSPGCMYRRQFVGVPGDPSKSDRHPPRCKFG